MLRNCLRKSWESLTTLGESIDNFFEESLVFLKKILGMFSEKSQIFVKNLLKDVFRKKWILKEKNRKILRSSDSFLRKMLNYF